MYNAQYKVYILFNSRNKAPLRRKNKKINLSIFAFKFDYLINE